MAAESRSAVTNDYPALAAAVTCRSCPITAPSRRRDLVSLAETVPQLATAIAKLTPPMRIRGCVGKARSSTAERKTAITVVRCNGTSFQFTPRPGEWIVADTARLILPCY
ncbi:unnamed protein product, partial [Iphiclides podalirius]